ncbi:uncharacterized protein LOC102713004 [Oryza brachyantha]|nr:uncharacterized protein LOC102713004 [Oryza brachyantha]
MPGDGDAGHSRGGVYPRRAGMHDIHLRPRLLRRVLMECLPLPDPDADLEPTRRPADLARALGAVREQGLLAERAIDPVLLEEWSAAVDAWVDRLLALLVSDREHSCWVGTSFLGLTFEECSDDRFAKSYSDWSEKILKTIKAPSCNKMVNMATCTAMATLFVRLAKFSNLKDEATFFAQKVVQPLLRLFDEDDSVAEKAADLLGIIIKLFPSSVYRNFNKVESILAAKIMSGQYNLQHSKKLASTLALLPCVRVSHNSLSLMIQKILIMVNNLLNGYTGHEIMMPIISPQLGGQENYRDWNFHSSKYFCTFVIPTISALVHCCSVMLTSSYPIQVNIPVPVVVTCIERVLLADIPLHQEVVFSEILALHCSFLDLLGAIINGMCSSLITHASILVKLISEYFKRAKLPAVRRKLYTIVRLLLSSMGFGMGMHLLQVIVSNISADLDDNSGGSPEPTFNRKSVPSLYVKIAALETFEVLLNMGGLFSACYWRTQLDLIINVARESFYMMEMYELKPLSTQNPTLSDFQLALLKALLASYLSSPLVSPYLEPGLELFNRGRLETGTELAKFCSRALLALDVLVHPREHCVWFYPKIALKGAIRGDLGPLSIASENKLIDSGRSKDLHAACTHRATENSGEEVNDWLLSTEDAPTDAFVEDNTSKKHAANEMSRDHSVQKATAIREHQEIVFNQFYGELQEVSVSSITDVSVAIAGTKVGSFNVASFPNNSDNVAIFSGALLGSHNVAGHTTPTSGASGVSASERDSLDPFLGIGNFGTETAFSFDMAKLDPDS